MSRSDSILGRATPLVLARVASAGLTVVIPLLLARRLPMEDFGTYKQLLLVAQTLYYVLPFGLSQSLYYFLPRGTHERAYLSQTLVLLSAVGMLAVGLLAWGSEAVAQAFSNHHFVAFRWPLGLYVLGVIVSSPLEVALTAEGKTREASVVYVASDGFRTLAMVGPVLLGHGLSGVMSGLMWVSLARAALTVGRAFVMKGDAFQPGLLWEQLRYTAPFGASVAVSVPQVYAHQFAVSSVVSPELFALYSVACFQLPLTHLLYTPVSEVLMVRVGELRRQGLTDAILPTFQQAVQRLCFAFIPLAFFSFVAAPEMLTFLFGDTFEAAVPLYRIGVFAMVLASFPVDGLLRALGHTPHLFRVAVLKLLLTLPLLWWAVVHFGMAGAMWVSLTVEVVATLLLLRGVPGALDGRPLSRLLPWRQLAQATLAGLGAVVSVWAVREGTQGRFSGLSVEGLRRGVPLALTGVSFLGGYAGMLRLMGVGAVKK